MKRIKIVQIGLGHDHAMDVMDSILSMPGIFDVVGFALPEAEEEKFVDKAKKWLDRGVMQMTVEEALSYSGLDGAIIETEEKNLVKYAIMAAEKNLHIHMDKPGGFEPSEFEKLIGMVKEKKLAFSMGYMYRFNPVIKEVIAKIQNGELGEIYSIEAHMNCMHPRDKRQWLEGLPGGMMFYLGCHLIDLIYNIQGIPEEIIPFNMPTGHEGVTSDELGMAVFKYKNGVSFIKCCALEQGGYMRRQIVICGTKGTVEIRPIEAYDLDNRDGRRVLYTGVRELYNKCEWCDDAEFKRSDLYNRYDDMMKSFAKMIVGEVIPDYDYEKKVYKLVLKACGAL